MAISVYRRSVPHDAGVAQPIMTLQLDLSPHLNYHPMCEDHDLMRIQHICVGILSGTSPPRRKEQSEKNKKTSAFLAAKVNTLWHHGVLHGKDLGWTWQALYRLKNFGFKC